MKGEERVKLKVGLNYTVISAFIATIIMIVSLILPFALPNPPNIPIKIAWVSISAFFAIISATAGILSYQTAILDENGIVFKSALREIAKIKWTDIIKVDTQELSTLRSTLKDISVKWIVFYTEKNQEAKHGGGNVKNKPPWQIKYSKKNVDTIKDYLKRYSKITLNIK